ncbi:hypothetical protein [Pelobacter seleniigenes]|uniref:hypothetical protein n=1 Tax=Pelobacter seleniigenes TaxID=407188 RepID=UPI00068F4BA9|nr:hypothetical protein [Pelobacter seleniigenes]
MWLLLLCTLSACSSSQNHLAKLAKTDIDMVADIHIHQSDELLRRLAGKLYRRNPRELHKIPGMTVEGRLAQLFGGDRSLLFSELDNQRGVEAMLLAFDQDYAGDRVFALLVGLVSMVHNAYGDNAEFFMFDSLDPQILYNSARNIEILVWRLKARTGADGKPLLLTNSLPDEAENLSFERLFGKLISLQDMMSAVAAQKWDRTVNFVVQRAATATFLPIGL